MEEDSDRISRGKQISRIKGELLKNNSPFYEKF